MSGQKYERQTCGVDILRCTKYLHNMVRVVRRCNAGGGSQRRSRLSPLGETVPYSPVDRLLRTCWSVSDSHTDTSDDPASRSNQAAPPNDPSLQTSPS